MHPYLGFIFSGHWNLWVTDVDSLDVVPQNGSIDGELRPVFAAHHIWIGSVFQQRIDARLRLSLRGGQQGSAAVRRLDLNVCAFC